MTHPGISSGYLFFYSFIGFHHAFMLENPIVLENPLFIYLFFIVILDVHVYGFLHINIYGKDL